MKRTVQVKQWIADLKVGDFVFMKSERYKWTSIEKVTHRTPQRVRIGYSEYKLNGYPYGYCGFNYKTPYRLATSEEVAADIKAKQDAAEKERKKQEAKEARERLRADLTKPLDGKLYAYVEDDYEDSALRLSIGKLTESQVREIVSLLISKKGGK
jgi:hypothetical protein